MKITKRLFDEVLVLEPPVRADRRGTMADFSPEMIRTVLPDKEWILQRIYTMPERHTFFGIHFQKDPYPQAKLISVLQGKDWTMWWICGRGLKPLRNGSPWNWIRHSRSWFIFLLVLATRSSPSRKTRYSILPLTGLLSADMPRLSASGIPQSVWIFPAQI